MTHRSEMFRVLRTILALVAAMPFTPSRWSCF